MMRSIMLRVAAWGSLLLGVPAVSLPAAVAQDDAKEGRAYYAGKTVRMIVGTGPASGYDSFTRLIAPYLAKTLGATVIVENQPGAGGMIALNRVFMSPPDGLTLSLSNGTAAAFAQLTSQQGARFDLTRFGYLATVGAPPSIWLVAPDSPFKTVQQALDAKKKWSWAATGSTASMAIGAAFTCEALRMDCLVVPGYNSGAQAALAVTRNEMDALHLPESAAANFVGAKQTAALATMSRAKSRYFPNRPTIFEAVTLTEDQAWAFDFYDAVSTLGRIIVVAPGMPPARLTFLQQAVRETLHNPELNAEGEKTDRIIEYLDPDSTRKNAVSVVSAVTSEQKERVLKILARARGGKS